MSFEIYAAHEPLAQIAKRDGTLGGSVPLRVAQACAPLLEGNALGHQVALPRRVVFRARLGAKRLEGGAALADIDRAHRAVVPALVARGYLPRGGAWQERLEKRWWWIERGVVRIWTGLLVRPRRGTWLRVSGPGSRAPRGMRVRTSFIGSGAFVPLVIDFDVLEDGTRLEGDVATLTPVIPSVTAEIVDLTLAPEMLERHVHFYDAKYFATKKGGEITRKYRRTIARAAEAGGATSSSAILRVAHVAGPRPEVCGVEHVLGADATSAIPAPPGERLETVRFGNAVAFRAHFDGSSLDIAPDAPALERGARAIRAAAAGALGSEIAKRSEGALLYLTKYFTPHPRGEPHFFVKPWAFTETPTGWSSVLDGIRGEGYEVMRGVVWTDRFHATPAVFDLQPMRRVRVREGAPLLDVFPVPRALLAEEPVIFEEALT